MFVLLIAASGSALCETLPSIREGNVTVFFEPALKKAARQIAADYPTILGELEESLGWTLHEPASVLIIQDRVRFQRMAESPLTVAFAVPARRLIVMDYPRVHSRPFGLANTLKHELCHLVLHRHIGERELPRWLDEGVCQWVSDGLADIFIRQRNSPLNRAAIGGDFIPFSALNKQFPSQEEPLMLAYEQSRDFVSFIIAEYGKEGLLNLLERLKGGGEVQGAFRETFSVSMNELEKRWQQSVDSRLTWFVYLSYHIYEFLFAFMALISVLAFVKVLIKKRQQASDESAEEYPWC